MPTERCKNQISKTKSSKTATAGEHKKNNKWNIKVVIEILSSFLLINYLLS